MNWTTTNPGTSSQRLRAPDDGIVASSRPPGWIGQGWNEIFEPILRSHHAALAKGRTLARGGRVRDLWFSPGLANAEVVAPRGQFRVSVRVRVFSDEAWDQVTALLLGDLQLIAALLEGELPIALIDRLGHEGLPLMPNLSEIDGDCDCRDFKMPCAHACAVHQVLADALDGDPFLLLTLRGRNRDQLLMALRRHWGDDVPLLPGRQLAEVEPAEGDWFASPEPLQVSSMRLHHETGQAIGLRALGPPPGKVELSHILAPLYTRGAEAAYLQAMNEHLRGTDAAPRTTWGGRKPSPAPTRRRAHASAGHRGTIQESRMGQATAATPQPTLTEQLVDLLASTECAKSKDLAEQTGVTLAEVRGELLELEKLGIVYRTGQTRGTRWWLG